MDSKIIIYSASYCTHCKLVKMYMDAKGIEYEERDIEEDNYKKELENKGLSTIPVLVVNGEYHPVNSSNFRDYLEKLKK